MNDICQFGDIFGSAFGSGGSRLAAVAAVTAELKVISNQGEIDSWGSANGLRRSKSKTWQ
jgi:hypothetical protein